MSFEKKMKDNEVIWSNSKTTNEIGVVNFGVGVMEYIAEICH
jgi:hypothetical protein